MPFNKLITTLGLLAVSSLAYAGAGITYHGRLMDPNGDPVVGPAVQFKLQVRTPGTESCLLYEETQSKDLSQSSGVFSVTLNDGSGIRTDSSGLAFEQIFSNKNSLTFAASACSTGTTYTPTTTDGRKLQVYFNDGRLMTAGQWEPSPAMSVNFVPTAIDALQLGGYKKDQVLKIADGVSQTGTELNSTSWANLLALIAGTSTQYLKPSDPINQLSGASLPAPANGQSLRWNSTLNAGAGGWENFTAGSATGVTSVSSANTDIAVASSTTTPVLTLNSGTGANQILKLDGTAKIPAVDGSQLTGLSASNISAGTLAIARGGTGATSANAAFNALTPAQTGNSGKFLTTDGTNTSWATVSGGGGVSGSGTAGNIAKFTAGTALGNSLISETTGQISVAGQIVSRGTPDAGTATTIDFNNGNAQFTTTTCQAITLQNMIDGGSYSLTVKGTSGTCSFTHSTDAIHFAGGGTGVTVSSHTVFSFMKMGADIYVTWTSF